VLRKDKSCDKVLGGLQVHCVTCCLNGSDWVYLILESFYLHLQNIVNGNC
jgi:hypothetical protein